MGDDMSGFGFGTSNDFTNPDGLPDRTSESVPVLSTEEIRSMRATVRRGTETLAIAYPVIEALRTWRDTANTPAHPRAIQDAELATWRALEEFENQALDLADAAALTSEAHRG